MNVPHEERFLLIEGPSPSPETFAEAVRKGLSGPRKSLPCRFLYDEVGSRLFEEICRQPEYYVTRVEADILAERALLLPKRFPGTPLLVEFGSGSADKTRRIIEGFLEAGESLHYVPMDISRPALVGSAAALLDAYPALRITAVHGEYAAGLDWLRSERPRLKLVLWLGSNIGNFSRDEAVGFLRRAREGMTAQDRFLLGADLRKDARILEAAYDDAAGVTAAFNLNLLARINRELGGHFDLDAFRHRAVYLEREGRVEMRIESLRRQEVPIDNLEMTVRLAAGEEIHTEDSYKSSPRELERLVSAAGFSIEETWSDSRSHFALLLLKPVP